MIQGEDDKGIRGVRFSYSDEDRLEVKLLQCAFCKFYKGGKCGKLGEVPKAIWEFEANCIEFRDYKE